MTRNKVFEFINRKYIKYPTIIIIGLTLLFISQDLSLKAPEGFLRTLTEDMIPMGLIIGLYGFLASLETIYWKWKEK